MNVRDLLIALLRNAIKGEAINRDAIEKFLNDEKLATLFKVSKKHDVAHLVCFALEQNGFNFDGETWKSFVAEKKQAKLRYEMIRADIDEIFACFEEEGIDYIPLKGAIIREHYPEPWMRTSCDIDILVREKELDRAVKALVEGHQYKTDGKKTYHDISLFSPFGMHLELHHNIKESEPKYDALLSQVWDYSYKADGGEHKYVQSNEFLMLHLIAHMAYHFVNGGCGLRSVVDIWILEQELDFDKEAFGELLNKAGLCEFYRVIRMLGSYWMEQRETEEKIVLDVEKHVLLGGAYGTRTQNATAGRVKKGGRFKYFWTRIFMPYKSLTILYPVIKKHKILTPFCQVARWFSVLFKRKRIANEIKRVASTDKSQVEEMKDLFDGLGL